MKKYYFFLAAVLMSLGSYAQYNMRANNGQTITTCQASIESSAFTTDPLGCSGGNGYCNNEDYQVTFYSGSPSVGIAILFVNVNFGGITGARRFGSESGYDYLYVYNNATGTGAPIATLTGVYTTPLSFQGTSGYITLKWHSDNINRNTGFTANVGCQPSGCNGNLPAGDLCTNPTQICDLNGYCGNTSGWYTIDNSAIQGGNPFCGSIENNSWISFIASATTATLNVSSNNCIDNNSGIQAAVMAGNCGGTFTLKSNCVDQNTSSGAFTLNATGLTIGTTYYLMVDGYAGNICDYSVQAISGVQTVNISSTASGGLCPGQPFTLNANASGTGPFTYSWSPAPNSGQGTASASYTATASGTYSVTITGACGAAQTETYYQTVSAPPSVSVSGTTSICAGGSTTLSATGTNTSSTVSFTNTTNYNIPDNNSTGVTSNITVSGIPGTVGTQLLSVCLNIQHGWDEDLDISLRCPSGTIIDLSTDNGGSGNNYTNTCFSTAGSAITSGSAPFTGTFTPEQAFSLLSGCAVNGTWSLIVKDDTGLDAGILQNWTLTFQNGLIYTWAPGTGLSGTTGTSVSANPTTTTTYTVTAANYVGCSGTTTVTVTVNPSPVATATPNSQAICSGATTGISLSSNMGGTSYSWTVSQTNVSGATAGTGSTIAQALTATSTVAGTAVYTITPTAAGCAGTPITVTITVNPRPVVTATPASQSICSNSPSSIALTSNIGSTTYAWTVVQTNVSGASAGSGATISQVLTATTGAAGTAVYTVTPTANGCAGTPITVTITVNPAPTVTATPVSQAICSGNTTGISLSGSIAGTTFAWTVVQTNVSGASAGSGSSIAQTLTATSTTAGTAVYTITPTANGCPGTPINVTITVNPKPVVTATPASQTICSGTASSVTLSSNMAGTTYAWTVVQTNVSGASAGTGSNIGQTLTATTSAAGTAVYTVTPTANGCAGNPITVTITVNPPPVATATPASQTICSGSASSIALSSTIGGTTYSWTVVQTNVSGATPGSGSNIAQTLTTTTTTSAGTAVYTITPMAGTCGGSPITVTITVNPRPVVTATPSSQTICSGNNTGIALSSNMPGTTYTWTVIQTGVSGASAGSGASIIQSLTTTGTTSGSATYSITPLSNGCAGTPISVTVTVNPAPVATATPSSQGICSGSNTGISLSGNVVGTTFSWTVSQTNVSGASAGSGSNITQALTATTASAGTAVYTITPTANGCPGTAINVTITVNPSPVVTATPATQTFCTGGTTGIALTSSVVGTTFSWTVTQTGVTGGGSGSGTNIAQVLNTTGTSAGTAVYTITPTANGCSGSPLNVTINVNPRDNASFTYGSSTYCQTGTNPSPTITGLAGGTFTSSPAGLSINSSTGLINLVGSALNTYTVTYTTGGICPNTSSVNITISSAPSANFSYSGSPFCQYGANPFPTFGAGASAGTFSSSPAGLNFVNVNTGQINLTTSSPGTYTVTNAIAASGGCASASATFMITISPAPVATATPASQTICSGTATGIVLSSSLGGTTYSWTITQSGVTGASAGSGSSISQTLTATGASAGTAIYTITPASGGCVGLPISVTITVNPTPVATASPNTQTICSGTAPNISLSSTVAGTTFNWTVVQTNVTGASAGSGSSIGQILTATSTTAGTAVYTITPIVSGCTGSPITVTITVNPNPVVTPTPAAQSICSGSATGITLTSNVTGATFSWTVTQSGVSGAANGTGTSITQVLSATGSASGTAVYTITPTANGCAGTPVTVTITVNPLPSATATPSIQTICTANPVSTSLTSSVTGTTFSWIVSQTGVIGSTAGSGSTISQNLTATGMTAGTAVYTITPLANGCSGSPVTFTATVNPAPNVTASPSPQTICSGTATSVTLTSNVTGATFSWTVTSQVGATGATAGSGTTIAQVLTVTGSSAGTVVYSVTPLANGCSGAPVSVTVNVNPIPFVTATPATQTICSGASTSISLTSFTSGTTFSWTASNGPGISGASAGSGATISQMLSNSQITAGQAIYTITPNAGGCSGSSVNVTINVNPTPVMNPASQTICSGATTNIPLTSNVTGTTYSWSAPAQTGASGGSPGSGSPIAQTLTATGGVSGTVTYNVTPSANSCPGTPIAVTVTVDPNPSGTAIPASSTICSGANTSIPLTSNIAGTTYTWTATASGVSGQAGGSGTNINQTLSATGSSAGTVTYNVTATSPAGCSSVLAPVVITVNPIPLVTATASPATICSGSPAVISLTSNVAGTTYTWTVSQTNVTGATAGSGSSINQVLNNVLPSAGVATYTITPLASGCSSSTPIIVDVNVNPIPTITTSGVSQNICNGTSTSITMTSDVAGSTFDWTVTSTGVTGAFAGSGNAISQSLSLTGATAGTVVYSITPAANGCSGTPADVTVTINPIDDPSFNYSASTFCQTGTDPSASITGGASGVFSASPVGLVFLDSLTGLIDVSASAIGNYALTFTTNGICSNSNTINVTITTAPDASFSYATPFCQSGMAFPVFGTGASAGVFSANPAGVNFVNTASGQIDLANSSPGTYVITNFITAGGGCAPSTDTATIVINQAATVNASLDSTICEGVVYTLTGSMGGSSSSIIWSTNGTGTFGDSTNINSTYTPSVADVVTGIVTLTITSNDPAGVCVQSSDNIALTIIPLDNASFSYSGGTFCQSGTDPIASVVGLSGGQFTYTPTGLVIDSSTGLVDLSSSTLGTYEIYYTTNGACPHTDSVTLTITTAPEATFTFNSSATAFCQSEANPTPVFSAGASAGTFTVTPSGLTFVSASTGEIDLANSTPGTYTLTNTIVAAGGCASAVDSLVITVDQPAIAEAGVAGTICSGNPFIISGDTIGGTASSFIWSSNGSGAFDTTNILHPVYTPSAADISAGIVTLIITTNDPAGACSSVMDSVILTINQTPVLPTVITPGIYCAGSSVNPISFTGSGGTVNWYSDSTLSTPIGTGNPFTPSGITNTTTIWVTETVGPCVSTVAPVTITFNPLPVADTSNIVITGATCGNATGSISNVAIVSGQGPFTYLWQDSLGNNVGDSLSLMNAGSGVYTLTIIDANGCTAQVGGSSGLSVTSTSGVTASFTSDFTTGETPLVVNFTNTCTGGVIYLWQFPNNDTASTLNANYTFTQLGLNRVCLIADNGVGCTDSICSEIDVYINSVFVIPNIFTPNGDDVNDVFTVKNVGLEKMDAEIYNRWGQKEYEWHTTNGGWDGRTTSGVLVPDGTYFFMIRAKGYDGKEYFEKGSFELMR